MVDGGVVLEVVIPTITKGGDAVEDVVGTSSAIVWEEVAIEEAPVVVSHDVVLSHLGLQWPWKGEPDVGSVYHVCTHMARLAPNHAGPHDTLAQSLVIVVEEG